MHYLIKNFKSSWQVIKKHKFLFLLVIFLEIIFLASFLYVGINDHLKIIKNAQNIIEPIEGANFDAESIQTGKPFLKEFSSIEKSAQQMKKGLFKMVGKLFFLFIILNGLIWTQINQMISIKLKNKIKLIFQSWLKFITSSAFLFGLLYVIIKIIIKNHFTMEFTEQNFKDMTILIGLFTIIIYYFLTVSFAFLNTKNWKEFVKKIFYVGIVKINKTGIIALINIILIIGCAYLINLSTNYINLYWLLIPLVILFIIILAFTKVYWLINLQQISESLKK